MQAHFRRIYLAKIVFTLKNYPLLLPSHNCIIISNVQFSRCKLSFFPFPSRNSMKLRLPPELQSIPSNVFHSFLLCRSFKRGWWANMDSLFCGKATAVATCHRHVAKSRLSSPFFLINSKLCSFLRLPICLGRLEKWWAKMDSNHRPHDYQSCALAS